MTALPAKRIEWIAIDRITVVNPRLRNKRVFREIVENIAQIGLKRPITVTRRVEADGPFYDLVCGQGRLEAYQELGQKEVPALIVSADVEDCMIASLVENCARRQHSALDLLQDIGGMRTRGYSHQEIARKTGLSYEYVYGVSRLLEKGEQKLLRSVESRKIPLSVAVEIAESEDHNVQEALHDAYEKGLLKGKRLIAAQKLVEDRRRRGKQFKVQHNASAPRLSTAALVKAYEEDVDRKRDLIRRANGARDRLMLIVEALRRLQRDDAFAAMLEDEHLSTMPENLQVRLSSGMAVGVVNPRKPIIPVRLGFEEASLRIPLDAIMPMREVADAARKSIKYNQIAASIAEVGIIEPPVVARDAREPDCYHLLDGHFRLDILRTRGEAEVVCLVSTDDEAFTYNKRVSRIAIIQEHRMILNAIRKGVSEERLARALNVNISSIRVKRNLLAGICPEVADLLRDRHVSIHAFTELRRLKPMRQIEAARAMVAMNRFSEAYAKSLVASTPAEQLVEVPVRRPRGLTSDQIAVMQRESENIDREFRTAEQRYSEDHLDLVLAIGYVGSLLDNARIVRHLAQHHPHILSEFQKIAQVDLAA